MLQTTNPLIYVIFDDNCLICSKSVQLIHRFDTSDRFRFVSFQSEFAKQLGLEFHFEASNPESFVCYTENCVHTKAAALRKVVKNLPKLKPLGVILEITPSLLLDKLYTLIAQNRHLLGKHSSCTIADARLKAKILVD